MKPDFGKGEGLLPAIVQDDRNGKVLMLGYMNEEALHKTREIRKVTFFSRSRQQLWTKGETSGNYLHLKSLHLDCDADTLLVRALPEGPVCHTGNATCFHDDAPSPFLPLLQDLIEKRKAQGGEGSYTVSLFRKGIKKIAQKVGEEAVECVLEAENGSEENLLNEAADLLYHLLVLLSSRGLKLNDVEDVLRKRH